MCPAGDPYTHVLTNVPDAEVKARQGASAIILQKSPRKGFALTVAEGLLKSRAVVGGAFRGIPVQVIAGRTGCPPADVGECAERVRTLLRDAPSVERLAATGREHVRRNFLITRVVRVTCCSSETSRPCLSSDLPRGPGRR